MFGLDLPGVDPGSVDIDVERPRGLSYRQIVLGDSRDTERVQASYAAGVLALRILIAEKAKPRRIEITNGAASDRKAIAV